VRACVRACACACARAFAHSHVSTAARFLRGGKEDVLASRLELFPLTSTLFIKDARARARERERESERERERERERESIGNDTP
jgi:hypothetical protein